MTKDRENQSTNGNGLRDYSHLPRAKDLRVPKKLSKLEQELKKAGQEALKALEEEEKKYGISVA